jgi:hypothetical protein
MAFRNPNPNNAEKHWPLETLTTLELRWRAISFRNPNPNHAEEHLAFRNPNPKIMPKHNGL